MDKTLHEEYGVESTRCLPPSWCTHSQGVGGWAEMARTPTDRGRGSPLYTRSGDLLQMLLPQSDCLLGVHIFGGCEEVQRFEGA